MPEPVWNREKVEGEVREVEAHQEWCQRRLDVLVPALEGFDEELPEGIDPIPEPYYGWVGSAIRDVENAVRELTRAKNGLDDRLPNLKANRERIAEREAQEAGGQG